MAFPVDEKKRNAQKLIKKIYICLLLNNDSEVVGVQYKHFLHLAVTLVDLLCMQNHRAVSLSC